MFTRKAWYGSWRDLHKIGHHVRDATRATSTTTAPGPFLRPLCHVLNTRVNCNLHPRKTLPGAHIPSDGALPLPPPRARHDPPRQRPPLLSPAASHRLHRTNTNSATRRAMGLGGTLEPPNTRGVHGCPFHRERIRSIERLI